MQAELQNLTLAVIGAIAAAVIGFLKWYPEHRKLKAQMEIKREDAQLADKAAERKQDDDQWDLLKTSLQTGVQAAQNTLQLATQMAIMSQLMERKLELITGIKTTVEGSSSTLIGLDTFTRENLAPIADKLESVLDTATRMDKNIINAASQIESLTDIAIASADASNDNLEALRVWMAQSEAKLIAAIEKRKTDTKPIPIIEDDDIPKGLAS